MNSWIRPCSEDDKIHFILNGFGTKFRDISTTIMAREQFIFIEELFDKHYEWIIKQEESVTMLSLNANTVRWGPSNNSNRQRWNL